MPAAFAGAVLTGGASRRMGRDKTLLEVDGTPMGLRVAAALRAAGAAPVVAVGGDGPALSALGLTWHADRHPGEGPLGGLLSAFAAVPGAELVVVLATDLPDVTAGAITALVAGIGGHDAALARREVDDEDSGGLEPLCAVWRPAACRPVLERAFATGERAVHRAWADLDLVGVAVPPQVLRNVNTLGDLGR
jgi:molybdopterin-guanine dinucleotide biosynthesis protein A